MIEIQVKINKKNFSELSKCIGLVYKLKDGSCAVYQNFVGVPTSETSVWEGPLVFSEVEDEEFDKQKTKGFPWRLTQSIQARS